MPRESGWSGLPTIFVTRPSFTCAFTPQPQKQSSQYVGDDAVALGAGILDAVRVEPPPARGEPGGERRAAGAAPPIWMNCLRVSVMLSCSFARSGRAAARARTGNRAPKSIWNCDISVEYAAMPWPVPPIGGGGAAFAPSTFAFSAYIPATFTARLSVKAYPAPAVTWCSETAGKARFSKARSGSSGIFP